METTSSNNVLSNGPVKTVKQHTLPKEALLKLIETGLKPKMITFVQIYRNLALCNELGYLMNKPFYY